MPEIRLEILSAEKRTWEDRVDDPTVVVIPMSRVDSMRFEAGVLKVTLKDCPRCNGTRVIMGRTPADADTTRLAAWYSCPECNPTKDLRELVARSQGDEHATMD